jgi:hypothetical protein
LTVNPPEMWRPSRRRASPSTKVKGLVDHKSTVHTSMPFGSELPLSKSWVRFHSSLLLHTASHVHHTAAVTGDLFHESRQRQDRALRTHHMMSRLCDHYLNESGFRHAFTRPEDSKRSVRLVLQRASETSVPSSTSLTDPLTHPFDSLQQRQHPHASSLHRHPYQIHPRRWQRPL